MTPIEEFKHYLNPEAGFLHELGEVANRVGPDLLTLVDAVEVLMANWPQKRDGMDLETLPVGVKATRDALARLKDES